MICAQQKLIISNRVPSREKKIFTLFHARCCTYQERHEPMTCEMTKVNCVSEGRDADPLRIKGASSANNSKS